MTDQQPILVPLFELKVVVIDPSGGLNLRHHLAMALLWLAARVADFPIYVETRSSHVL